MSQPNISHLKKGFITYTIPPYGANFTSGMALYNVPGVPRVERAYFLQATHISGSVCPGTTLIVDVYPTGSLNQVRLNAMVVSGSVLPFAAASGTYNFAITIGVEY
jgi:hypothetical protein